MIELAAVVVNGKSLTRVLTSLYIIPPCAVVMGAATGGVVLG